MNCISSAWTPALITAVLLLACAPESRAESPGKPQPRTLKECYLQIVADKHDADMALAARELCDSVFSERKASIVVLDSTSKMCSEWWLDRHGRYESRALYCAMQSKGDKRWNLSCQHKDKPTHVTWMNLIESDDMFTPDGPALGDPLGPLYSNLAACVRAKIKTP